MVPEDIRYRNKHSLISKIFFTFSFIYYGFTILIILLALIFHGFLLEIASTYIEGFDSETGLFFAILSLLLVLHILIIVGLFLFYYQKHTAGLILYLSGSVVLFVIQMMSVSSEGYQKIYLDLAVSIVIIFYFWYKMSKKKTALPEQMKED